MIFLNQEEVETAIITLTDIWKPPTCLQMNNDNDICPSGHSPSPSPFTMQTFAGDLIGYFIVIWLYLQAIIWKTQPLISHSFQQFITMSLWFGSDYIFYLISDNHHMEMEIHIRMKLKKLSYG